MCNDIDVFYYDTVNGIVKRLDNIPFMKVGRTQHNIVANEINGTITIMGGIKDIVNDMAATCVEVYSFK